MSVLCTLLAVSELARPLHMQLELMLQLAAFCITPQSHLSCNVHMIISGSNIMSRT